MRNLAKVTLTCLAAMILTGCGRGTTLEDSATSSVSNPTEGVVDDSAGFYVKARASDKYTYYTHKGTSYSTADSYSWSSECKISASATGNDKDVVCYIEANEWDLHFHGIEIQYNVPSDMCTYVRVTAPWYFKAPTGAGPTLVNIINDTRQGNDPYPASTTDVPGSYGTAQNHSGGQPYCAFNYSATDSSLPNCCAGKYTKLTHTIAPEASPSTTFTVSSKSEEGDWGGSLANCLSGPAMELQAKSKSGFPLAENYYVEGTGINKVQAIGSLFDKDLPSNRYLSTYFGTSDFKTLSSWPAAFYPTNNTATILQYPATTSNKPTVSTLSAQPFWEYTCYNRAREAQYRIRTVIRSWDQMGWENVATSYAPNSSSATEDTPFTDQYLHDLGIWPDVVPGSYTSWTQGYPSIYD